MILVALAGVVLYLLSRQESAIRWEGRIASWAAANARPLRTAPQTAATLVEIDDTTLATRPGSWTPLDFTLFARAVLPLNPDVVGIEEVLNWDQSKMSQDDRVKFLHHRSILREFFLRSPKLVLGARLGAHDDPQRLPPLQEAPILRHIEGDHSKLAEWTAITNQPEEELRLSATLGFTNFNPDRRPFASTPLVLGYRGQIVPTFPLQALLLWYKLSPDDVRGELGSHLQLGDQVRIPIDERGEMLVNLNAGYTRIAFDDLLLSVEQRDANLAAAAPLEKIAKSVTILARTDGPARRWQAGTKTRSSEGELFVAAVSTVQARIFPSWAPLWAHGAIILVTALLCFPAPKTNRRVVTLAAVGALIAYAGLYCALLLFANVWMPIVLPVGLFVFVVAYRWATPDWAWKPRRPVIF